MRIQTTLEPRRPTKNKPEPDTRLLSSEKLFAIKTLCSVNLLFRVCNQLRQVWIGGARHWQGAQKNTQQDTKRQNRWSVSVRVSEEPEEKGALHEQREGPQLRSRIRKKKRRRWRRRL